MRILIAPNAFKGTLTARSAAQAIADGLRRVRRDLVADRCPIADGGDGTLDVLVDTAGFEARKATVCGPLGTPLAARWAWRALDRTAAVESAEVAGLRLVPPESRDPMRTTSRGVGELMAAAREAGAARIIVGVGGSATVDGATGALAALGWRFVDDAGEPVEVPISLDRCKRAERPGGAPFPPVEVLCDVDNPLLGPKGAVAVFGPQKGAKPDEIPALERRLSHVVSLLGGRPQTPGMGAAGGLAYGLSAALGGRLVEGGTKILELLGFAAKVAAVDLVITGEGRLDPQTLHGKGPFAVAKAARAAGKPCIAVCGSVEQGNYEDHFAEVVELLPDAPNNAAGALTAAGPRLLAAIERLLPSRD